jgi:threonine dehydratase
MLDLLESAMEGLNIIDFQYGKVDPEKAWPVIGFEANPMQLEVMYKRLNELGIPYEDVTSEEDVEFRIIHYEPNLFANPYFIKLEFPERPGALHDFLQSVRDTGNMCYFNYWFSGEQVGRAMIGFEFESEEKRAKFMKGLRESRNQYWEISQTVLDRVL